MADIDVMQTLGLSGGQIKNMGGTVYDTILYAMVFLMIVGVIVFIFYVKSFNRKVTVNYSTKGNVKFVVQDKAKLIHKKGAEYWKLYRLKKWWLAPPGEAVRITQKGRFYAECEYKEGDDHPAWIVLKEGATTVVNGRNVNEQQTYFSPEDRALLVEQIEESEARKKGLMSVLKEMAVPIMLLIMFVLVLAFWNDIWQPMKDSQASMAVISTQQAKISEQNARLFSVMAGKLDKSELLIEQIVPADAELFGLNSSGQPG
jgi:hypothetical protein